MDEIKRKILIEVTPEEYEKVKAGALNEHVPTYDEVRNDVLENLSSEDIKTLISNHQQAIMDNVDDPTLISQILRRSDVKDRMIFHDPIMNRDFVIAKGLLEVSTQKGISNDTFDWTLKSYNEEEDQLK